MKTMSDAKTSDGKSFGSARVNTEEQPSSRGQSTDKLKKTTTLYNKAQNDLIKKLKLNTSPTATRTTTVTTTETAETVATEPSQPNPTINIQKFLQGSVTSTNRNSTPKTPVRNLMSSRMAGNTLSSTNLNGNMKKAEPKVSIGKPLPSKPIQDEISIIIETKAPF